MPAGRHQRAALRRRCCPVHDCGRRLPREDEGPCPIDAPDDIDSSLKDCTALDDEKTCTKEDKERIETKCSGPEGDHKCRKMCRPKYKKLSTDCKAACCPSFTPCQGKLEQFEGPSSTTLSINCPPGPGKVWGSNPYSQDSVFGKAVRHACKVHGKGRG